MIIDVHQHYSPPALTEAVAKESPGLKVLTEPCVELDSRLPEMDASGIDAALPSIPHPCRLSPGDDRAGYLALARRCNDELLAAAERHSDRFAALVALPFGDTEGSLEELERVAGHPLVKGVIGFTVTRPWSLYEPRLEPVYQAMAQHNLPFMLHPVMDDFTAHPSFEAFTLFGSIASPVQESVTAAQLMLSGMLDRVPELTLIIPHLGGVLPYLAQRLIDQSGTGAAQYDCLEYLRNRCLVDSCSYHQPALSCAEATMSAQHILLGSDYPYRGSLQRAVSDIETSGLNAPDRAAVYGGNAERAGLLTDAMLARTPSGNRPQA
ncbi:amidohydrolase family protein [Streptomyces sp. NBC_01217]|uniref:amidohydrolase family protein n=1 Tax=Streptomyces sp. NBC_01217 TaxID=2903779 RepID=UPI002E15455F|nr:amidohydrolase [Streptomyces sp. NBC_01217]WSQ62554.1 amidohydrolase [Streptomyces sp. NBC_01217]